MKKLLFPLLLLCSVQVFSQTRDLVALAKGDFLGMNALFDEKGDLFGYIAIYDYGKSGAKTKKFEYVILDKNLNPFANNTFNGDITAGDYYGYISFDGSVILKPSRYDFTMLKRKDLFRPSSMVINLKDNTIRKKIYYEFDHGTFKEIQENESWKEKQNEYKAEKKEKGYNYESSVWEIKEGGYIVSDLEDHEKYTKNNRLMRYDEHKKLLWTYEYNQDGSKKKREILYLLKKDSSYYYGLLREYNKKPKTFYYAQGDNGPSPNKYYLLVIDMKTGKELHKKEIPDPERVLPYILRFQTFGYGRLSNAKSFDDKIVLVGTISSASGYDHSNTGFTRLVIDRKTFDADLKLLSFEEGFKKYIPEINATGGVEKGYFLDPRDIFFMKDGSIGMLLEKYKPPNDHRGPKTTDLVYMRTDKNFNIAGVTLLEKEKSKWVDADYLFSQYLNDDNDLVFFYRDYQKDKKTKDKNWKLFINTYIHGKFKQDVIPISSKNNYLIFPYVAKDGYILLQEFNKKAKYNQIRLERLNY